MAAPMSPPRFRSGAWTYFAFVLTWSAVFWLSSTIGSATRTPDTSLLFLVGGAGPLIGAILLTHLRETTETRRDFWRRIVDVRLLTPRWLCIALLLHPAIVAVALVVDFALRSTSPVLTLPAGGLSALLGLVFFTFWFGPLPEEIGWRGYALDRLQSHSSALRASVVLGLVWAAWHLPLFAVPGTFQHTIGVNNPRFWIFLASMVPLSVLMTWVYNNTRRSTLSAALVHFTGNLCGALVAKTAWLAGIELALLTLGAAVVVKVYGVRHLARHDG